MDKTQSGLHAALASAEKGSLVSGDGITPLSDNSWYMIDAIASSGSTLPIGKVGAIFKTPDSGNAITPIVGDDVFPLTLTVQCKVTAEVNNEKGVIDVSDDCGDGYISSIVDGFTNISGTYSQFLKFDFDADKYDLNEQQKEVLNRFYDTVDDDGAGNYTVTDKNDDPYYLFIYLNRKAAIGEKINILIIPTILSAAANGLENKAGINFDVTWTKAEGWAGVYERVLNEALDL
jgi:hypothetical protein